MTVKDYVLSHPDEYANGLILIGVKENNKVISRSISRDDLENEILKETKKVAPYICSEEEKVKCRYTLLII